LLASDVAAASATASGSGSPRSASRLRSTRPSAGRSSLNRSQWVQAVRRRMKAASWRLSASIQAWNSSHICGVVCPSSRISQAAAAPGMSFVAVIGLSAAPEPLEHRCRALANGLVEQGLRAVPGRLDQLLLDRVLRDIHPCRDLLLRITIHLPQSKDLTAAL